MDCSGSSKAFEEFKYNNVEFNEDGNMLLVYSAGSVGFIAIPNKNAPGGNLDDNMMERTLAISASSCLTRTLLLPRTREV